MRIAVLGTGVVGRTVAARLTELDHQVTIGTRDVAATRDRGGEWGTWAAQHPQVGLATFADATAEADLVVNATTGTASLSALTAAGEKHLADRILLDIANPLDLTRGFPFPVTASDEDSLAEQIQRTFPDTKVVKSLNTLAADLMVNPRQLADGEHSVFVSGNDAEAKRVVTDLLTSFGHTDVIDLGDLSTARGTELLLSVWLRLYGTLGTPLFNFKIVR